MKCKHRLWFFVLGSFTLCGNREIFSSHKLYYLLLMRIVFFLVSQWIWLRQQSTAQEKPVKRPYGSSRLTDLLHIDCSDRWLHTSHGNDSRVTLLSEKVICHFIFLVGTEEVSLSGGKKMVLIISAGMFEVILPIIFFVCELLHSQNIKLTCDVSCFYSIDSLYDGATGFKVLNSSVDEVSWLLGWRAMSACKLPLRCLGESICF